MPYNRTPEKIRNRWKNIQKVPCPHPGCGAKAGVRCKTGPVPHQSRRRAAAAAGFYKPE